MQTPPSTPKKLECPWAPKPDREKYIEEINSIIYFPEIFFNDAYSIYDINIDNQNTDSNIYITPKNKRKYNIYPMNKIIYHKKRKIEEMNINDI